MFVKRCAPTTVSVAALLLTVPSQIPLLSPA
jgi:hypothetical protein